MKATSIRMGAAVVLAVALAARGAAWATTAGAGQSGLDPADFTAKVDHPLVPLSSLRLTVFRGSERDSATGATTETRVETRIKGTTSVVDGVRVTVAEEKTYEDGELVERTLDYFAQHRNGSVWYFGERVDDYVGGKVVDHKGQWLAGTGRAQPGLFMPAKPRVGQAFAQERAPGIAEDRSRIVAVGLKTTTQAGSFADCVRTRDYSPIDRATELKTYCPAVGLVREQFGGGQLELVRYR